MGTILNAEERKDLLVRHRGERDGRVRDRIKAVLLRDDGMSYGEIARVLFLSDEGVRQQIEDYLRQNGKLQPENGGSEARLTDEQAKKLEAHLDETLYTRTRDIVEYVKETFGVAYSVRGLTKWLKQHGFTYHKPVGVPAKADGEAQKAWIMWYEKFKKSLQDNEKILFMDGVHPTHAVRFLLVAGFSTRAEVSVSFCSRRRFAAAARPRLKSHFLGGRNGGKSAAARDSDAIELRAVPAICLAPSYRWAPGPSTETDLACDLQLHFTIALPGVPVEGAADRKRSRRPSRNSLLAHL